jgi:LytS/YehU family sensor histidine kinase
MNQFLLLLQAETDQHFLRNLAILSAVVSGLFCIWLYFKRRNMRKQEELIRQNEIYSLRLIALQKQIDPHFIFNCLNSLQNLFLSNKNKEANEYLSQFSELLRKTLDYHSKENSDLAQEIEAVRTYLELEKTQFDEGDFDYSIELDKSIDSTQFRTPNFLLQPFVENSVKYGKKQKGKLQINIRTIKREKAFILIIEDNGPGIDPQNYRPDSSGIRISRERLRVFNRAFRTNIIYAISNPVFFEKGKTGTVVEFYFGE